LIQRFGQRLLRPLRLAVLQLAVPESVVVVPVVDRHVGFIRALAGGEHDGLVDAHVPALQFVVGFVDFDGVGVVHYSFVGNCVYLRLDLHDAAFQVGLFLAVVCPDCPLHSHLDFVFLAF